MFSTFSDCNYASRGTGGVDLSAGAQGSVQILWLPQIRPQVIRVPTGGNACQSFREKLRELSLDKDSQGLRRPATILLRRRFSAVTTGTQRMAIDPVSPTITAEGVWGAGQSGFVTPQSRTLCDGPPVPPPTGSLTRDQVNDARRTRNVTTRLLAQGFLSNPGIPQIPRRLRTGPGLTTHWAWKPLPRLRVKIRRVATPFCV